MRINLSDHTLDALALVISGGSQNDPSPSIGLYRQGWQLVDFFQPFKVKVDLDTHSRLPATRHALACMALIDDLEDLRKVIEKAADTRDFIHEPARHAAVVDYLNKFLVYDNLLLEMSGLRTRLVEITKTATVVGSFTAAIAEIEFDTVERDLNRALKSAEDDPEDAVTAACSVIESVCRSILVELELPLPDKKDISALYRAVREPLGLSPDKEGVSDEISVDVKTVLGGLNAVIQGIGSLRTHAGDAHGRERGFKRIDPRIARLAIHSASAAALFLIETWQTKYPGKVLHAAA